MTAPRSGVDPASVRGLAVLAVAVVLGFLLLGGSDELSISTTSRSGGGATTTSTSVASQASTTTRPAAGEQPAKPPAEVKTVVLNGSGGVAKGVAGASTTKLEELGYQTADPANAPPVEATVVYFTDGFEQNAQAIKLALNLSGEVEPIANLAGGDVKDANVVVVLGPDAAALVEGGGDGSTTTSTEG